ncbi:MAG: PilZ domain-containing protein [Candidatus Solibacter sp.]
MSQRREPRFEIEQSLWITLFGEPDVRMPARVKNLSARGVGLELQGPVAAGSALKFEIDDVLLLGEVIYCRDDGDTYYVGVQLEQALYGLGELAKAVRKFTGETSCPEGAHAMVKRHRQD